MAKNTPKQVPWHPSRTVLEASIYLARAEAFEREPDLQKQAILRYKDAANLFDTVSKAIRERIKKLEKKI